MTDKQRDILSILSPWVEKIESVTLVRRVNVEGVKLQVILAI